jgi:DNA-binding protein H-NS
VKNIYFLCIQLSVYIHELLKAKEGGLLMAEEPKSVCEWLDINLDTLTGEDKLNLIAEIYDHLTAIQLRQTRDLAEQIRLEKLEDARAQVIAEMREKFVQLDLDFDEYMGLKRRRGKSVLPPKYKSPDGKSWSGRGTPPSWTRDLEEDGKDREEYLIKEEE